MSDGGSPVWTTTTGVVVEPPAPVAMTTESPAVPAPVVPVPVVPSGFVPVEPAVAEPVGVAWDGGLLASPEQAVTAISPRILPRTAT